MSKNKPNDFSHEPLVRLEFVKRTKRIFPLTEEEIEQLGKINYNLTWFMWLNALAIGTFTSFLISILDDNNSNISWLVLGASSIGIIVFSALTIMNRNEFKRTINYIRPDESNYLKVDMPTESNPGEVRFQRIADEVNEPKEQKLELPDVYVLNALYGTNKNTSDVRSVIQYMINSDSKFQVGNSLVDGKDPDYGNPKFLWLRYLKNNLTIERTFKEDEKVSVSEL